MAKASVSTASDPKQSGILQKRKLTWLDLKYKYQHLIVYSNSCIF